MRSSIFAAAVLLWLCFSPTIAQENPQMPRSVSEVEDGAFPEPSRRDPTAAELEQKALEAMTSGGYKKARRLFEDVLDLRPNDPRVLFNLACTLSRLGDLEQAATRLEASWSAGLRYPKLLRTDPDLEALRQSPEGGALIARLLSEEEQRVRRQGLLQFFEAPVLAGLRVVAPDSLEEGRLYPLVMALHGHGGSPEPYAGMFETTGNPIEAIVAAPYGPHPVALAQGHGYSWYPPRWLYRETTVAEGLDRGGSELERAVDEVSRRYVVAAIEAVRRSHPVDPNQIFLLGHSEGGGLAYDLINDRPDLFQGVIVIAAPFRRADAVSARFAAAAPGLRALICHSPEDSKIGIEHSERAHEVFRAAGIDSRLVRYAGGHGITADLVQRIAKWIRKSVKEKEGG